MPCSLVAVSFAGSLRLVVRDILWPEEAASADDLQQALSALGEVSGVFLARRR